MAQASQGSNPAASSNDMDFYVENLLFSFVPVTSLIAARYGQKAWTTWETLLSIAVAATLALRSELALPIIMNSPGSEFHKFLCAAFACYLFNSIVHPLVLSRSKDVAIFYGHHFGKIVSGSLIVIENLIAYQEGVHWNYKYLCLVTSFFLTSVLINAYFLARTARPSGQNPYADFANSVGKLDFYILFIYGTFVYAFPNLFLSWFADGTRILTAANFDESHRSLARICGALIIGNGIGSFCISEFKFIKDKKWFLFAHFLAGLVEASMLYAGHNCFKIYSFETMKVWLATSVVYSLILIVGFVRTPQDPKKAQ